MFFENGDFVENGKTLGGKEKTLGEDEKTSRSNPGENEIDEIEILFFLQNLERNLSQKYFFKKIFFFEENIFLNLVSRFLEDPKNCMFSFLLCWVLAEIFSSWKRFLPSPIVKSRNHKIHK